MDSANNKSGIVDLPSLPPANAPLRRASAGTSGGWSIAIPDRELKKTVSLHDLPEELTIKI
ncbi:hypothetical protein, partial [Endozoicomonas sp. SESOKO2]